MTCNKIVEFKEVPNWKMLGLYNMREPPSSATAVRARLRSHVTQFQDEIYAYILERSVVTRIYYN